MPYAHLMHSRKYLVNLIVVKSCEGKCAKCFDRSVCAVNAPRPGVHRILVDEPRSRKLYKKAGFTNVNSIMQSPASEQSALEAADVQFVNAVHHI